jgi:exodeoxyribonuclease V alpha subunit
MAPGPAADRFSPERALGLTPTSLLAQFNIAGVVVAADVHVAAALGRLGGDADPLVGLAAALAVRAPRKGHVLVDLATVAGTATAEADEDEEVDLAGLPWPELAPWLERLAESPLVSVGPDGPDDRPLRMLGSALYLDRYWRDEGVVAEDLLMRAGAEPFELDERLLAEGLARLFTNASDGLQSRAAETAVRRHLSVIAGGPGTGKTTTVARLLALLAEQAMAAGYPLPLVGLVAPTGKAAARMAEAVHDEAAKLGVDEAVREQLVTLNASTVHRLLGRHPAGANRFRHDRQNRLPHDVVVVDETSMMSLPLMARLLEAVRGDARLVLLGDQQQLASVEAGAVLGDIVGPAAASGRTPAITTGAATPTGVVIPTGVDGSAEPVPLAGTLALPLRECITVLQANHRFRGRLAELAAAVRAGDADATIAVLAAGAPTADRGEEDRGQDDRGLGDVSWLAADAAADEATLEPVRAMVLAAGRPLLEAARAGDEAGALDALSRLRILCAHRHGPAGASTWNARAELWLSAGAGPIDGSGPWYVGRPVIVTENDYSLGLFNGDAGVVVGPSAAPTVAFRRGAGIASVSPSRVQTVETAFAMTAHRAQGSEFDEVVVVLPSASSRALTRELLYTAVTRARHRALLMGTEASVRAAVGRPVARASGLTARLWG